MFKIYIQTYRKIITLLSSSLKKDFFKIQFLIIITSFFDLFGLAVFIPIFSLINLNEIPKDSYFLNYIYNYFNFESYNNFIMFLFVIAFVFFGIRSVFIVISQIIQNKFVFKVNEFVASTTLGYYLNSNFQEFSARDSSKLIRELTISPGHLSRFIIMPLFLLTSELIILTLIVGGIIVFEFKAFLLLAFTLFPAAFFFQKNFKSKLKQLGIDENEISPKLQTQTNRGILGYIDIKLRNKEYNIVNGFKQIMHSLNLINIKTSIISFLPSKIFEIISVLGLLLIYAYSVFIANDPKLAFSLITIYAGAGYRILPSLGKIVPSLMLLEQYNYLFQVFKPALTKLENHKNKESIKNIEFNNSIIFKDVSFTFLNNDQEILKKLNFTINSGEVIGIIGKSGSGKTTVVNLIAGLYKPSKGNLYVDNIKIDENNIRLWQKEISYVLQSPYIETGTLASNIAFIDDKVDELILNRSIEMASLSTFVNNRNPFEIEILENGKNLSGGQKQRIILARALYNNSKLIILDEATSALDNETEIEIVQAIEKLKGTGITIIIIAHRYSTLRYTDRIFELSKGEIIRELKYSELNTEN